MKVSSPFSSNLNYFIYLIIIIIKQLFRVFLYMMFYNDDSMKKQGRHVFYRF